MRSPGFVLMWGCAVAAYAAGEVNVGPAGRARRWTVVDGKPYLNYSQSVRRRWSSDIPGYVRKADEQWPLIKNR